MKIESTVEHPFAFFESFFDKTIYEELELFRSWMHSMYHSSEIINESTDIIKVKNVHHRDEVKLEELEYKLKHFMGNRYSDEVFNSKQLIDKGISQRLPDYNSANAYILHLKDKLKTFQQVKSEGFDLLQDFINYFRKYLSSFEFEKTHYHFIPSFNIKAKNDNTQMEIIHRLFVKLRDSHHYIECDYEEFQKAFSGQEVKTGVRWMIKGKNKLVNKSSLFYLINELIDSDFLDKSIINDLNKYIRYVFRDDLGGELKNIKQSKAGRSDNPECKNEIDNIITSLS